MGPIFSVSQSDVIFDRLSEQVDWEHDELWMYGKKIITKRKVAWYGDESYAYTYSKMTKYALPWTEQLRLIKDKIEGQSGETFNSCLLNLYHHGNEGMSWHSDDERELKPEGAIASMSFGAERKFVFKHKKSKEKQEIYLEHGSLLLMRGKTQYHWHHSLPPTKKVSAPRINLTFRTIIT